MKSFYKGASILIGTVVGAGILGIPFVVAKAGFLTSLITLLGIGIIAMLMNLSMGEITLRTKGNHQLTGYAGIYLGRWGRRLMAFSMIFGIYGALLAYMIGEGHVLSQLLGLDQFIWSIIFFAVGALIISGGIKYIEKTEFALVAVEMIIFAVIILLIFTSKNLSLANISEFNMKKMLIPYGVILFAYLGTSSIPSIKEEMINNLRDFKKALIIGSVVPIIIYLLFSLGVVALTGKATTQIATIGVGNMLGNYAVIVFNIFAFITLSTAFVSLGFALKEMFIYDFKMNKRLSWLLVISVPLIIFLSGIAEFTKTLEITGAISGGIAGVLIVLMYLKSQKRGNRTPEYVLKLHKWLVWVAIIVFLIGALFEVGVFDVIIH